MDALSETLRVVRLVGAIFINGRFTAPWCYQSPHADYAAPLLEPGAERVVIYHLITEGECFVEMAGQPLGVDHRAGQCDVGLGIEHQSDNRSGEDPGQLDELHAAHSW